MGDALLLLLTMVCQAVILPIWAAFPATEYEYSLHRDQLRQEELKLEGVKHPLTEDERLVNSYLQYLKWREFKSTSETGFPPSMPIEQVLANVTSSEVYRVLTRIPKGGNMHSHEDHEVSRRTILDFLYDSDDFKYLHVSTEDHYRPWTLDLFTTPPGNGWVKVSESNLTKDQILEKQTLLGVMDAKARNEPTNSALRWKQMSPMWGRATGPVYNIHIWRRYLRALYEKSLAEGVQYIETKTGIGGRLLYEMDPNATETNGKRYLERREDGGRLQVNITLEVLKEFSEENPSFIGHKRIIYTTRSSNILENVEKVIDDVYDLHLAYPDLIVGFDLVGEEDNGNSHLFFIKQFLDQYNPKTNDTRIPFYLHTAETNWPDDLISSLNDKDPVSTIQNAYEAILLGARRVGHGLGYIKHPYLLKLLKEKNVAIEACPISNQLLGYIPDLRNHPAVTYIRSGLPVVLGTDDPGSFGYDHFTVDWYVAFMAWGLDLADLQRLATNALQYSAMTSTEKQLAFVKFDEAWKKYINDVKKEACKHKFDSEEPVIGRILPREGRKSGGTRVHIFGRNFERAIPKMCNGLKVKCKFGEKESEAVYLSNYHISCMSPDPEIGKNVVELKFSLGDDWLSTGQNFTYDRNLGQYGVTLF